MDRAGPLPGYGSDSVTRCTAAVTGQRADFDCGSLAARCKAGNAVLPEIASMTFPGSAFSLAVKLTSRVAFFLGEESIRGCGTAIERSAGEESGSTAVAVSASSEVAGTACGR